MDTLTKIEKPGRDDLLYSDWLITNGIGGFASGSISCAPMRKYHALLIASLPVPFGRMVCLNHVADYLIFPDQKAVPLSLIRIKNQEEDLQSLPLAEFRLEDGLPVWRYEVGEIVVEKSLLLIQHQNTLHMSYKLLTADKEVEIVWRPFFHFRNIEESVNHLKDQKYTLTKDAFSEIITYEQYPPFRICNDHRAPFVEESQRLENVFYEVEEHRGYESEGDLTSPGFYRFNLKSQEKKTMIVSSEPWTNISVLSNAEALFIDKLRKKSLLNAAAGLSEIPFCAKLVLSADQFIMKPTTRIKDIVRIEAAGEMVRSIIAGFPWFLDWGRDTMISLEGLTLSTGRPHIASSILRTFAFYIRDGLIPNLFPDGQNEGLYNTADATLWFFHAVDRYVTLTGDVDILEFLIPKFHIIIEAHIRGTHFGIKVAEDGLLTQGQRGYALTWMDAKLDEWIVTPRRGKAVEINALWYNALKLYEEWTGQTLDLTARCFESFNQRFWNKEKECLYDIVDGEDSKEDPAVRPNQLFAISLKYPVLEKKWWKSVVNLVKEELLTPFGLRTLAASHPDYKIMYQGRLADRDAAYHQGTVWPWLLGPFIDAWLKVYPNDTASVELFLKNLGNHLESYGLNTISEIFDASDPHHARGCFAQAWSVAEFLRCYAKIAK